MNFLLARRNFSKDNKNWWGRFTDAPMRDISKMFPGKMFPAVSLGTIAKTTRSGWKRKSIKRTTGRR